ncbi:MAG: tRNA guanosine(15) transglycosylase TgtA [Cenarchaeum sp. SB0665_bin_23]|nr:tRNA guanosine(15) transglycosylase TgtA [Cenarchaeum sp. SB0667_bin_13]MXY60782.1 tRNA guanosine(15) transglycosylase TgtA [Cenarchaeum sp. SB0665_bin_23]MYB46552.1 tRNA guanosine(15) transglycosylase TgtA [Cenarchaeum sp. SB0662_bin_33]MYC79085.1 tRNA guanosine(15) transglycosylase TgtA [Cenarchaeum sp. SB0661_bin_35]MYG32544.1 tRNA guanosine(15) transglycosylase TgtA [Cenarchaeum sp. SB0677_bin_16]MYI51942.1 tRNA guanosine(15) transglycosylase TgtA [Cenarchaeum sp. SB0673_bin_9]
MFEIVKSDLAGRIGRLYTNHGMVDTPAYVPVMHPVKQTIPGEKLKEMGFQMIITNAYITMKQYGDEAIRRGIHDIVGFDGPIMTDSGGYQVLEYGDLDISPSQMAEFEMGIMTDIPIPLDKPTGFGLPYDVASSYVDRTLQACHDTIQSAKDNGQLWVGPIQGGEHSSLVERSARSLAVYGFQIMALGSPVEFMESYEYYKLACMIAQVRRVLTPSIPLHLFGAGHPITIPLAISLGCDTFDSASYMLYAKEDRYITQDGTRKLSEMRVFPCNCDVCTGYTPAELMSIEKKERTDLLALHNLYAIKLEVDATRQAIYEGRLWEYTLKKARAHPRLFEAVRVLTESHDVLYPGTPRFKEKAIFLFDHTDQYRPEAVEFRRIVSDFRTKKDTLYILPEPKTKPAYLLKRYADIPDDAQVCIYNPYLGIIPLELSDMYPAAHHLDARMRHVPERYDTFGHSLKAFLENNKFTRIHYDYGNAFLSYFLGDMKCTEHFTKI